MKIIRYIAMTLSMALIAPAFAEPVVIINAGNELSNLSKEDVIGLFMGRRAAFPNGQNALPFDQSLSSELRSDFYLTLTNKSTAQINAYWARLVFSGRATPPRALASVETILSTVRDNLDAIAYIDSKYVDSTVKVVFRFD